MNLWLDYLYKREQYADFVRDAERRRAQHAHGQTRLARLIARFARRTPAHHVRDRPPIPSNHLLITPRTYRTMFVLGVLNNSSAPPTDGMY